MTIRRIRTHKQVGTITIPLVVDGQIESKGGSGPPRRLKQITKIQDKMIKSSKNK